jgi:hypothetical protein
MRIKVYANLLARDFSSELRKLLAGLNELRVKKMGNISPAINCSPTISILMDRLAVWPT